MVRGKADLGIVSFPQRQRELTVIPWREEAMVDVICPRNIGFQSMRRSHQQESGARTLSGLTAIPYDKQAGGSGS